MPPLYIGSQEVDACYQGSNKIDKGMLGADEICSAVVLGPIVDNLDWHLHPYLSNGWIVTGGQDPSTVKDLWGQNVLSIEATLPNSGISIAYASIIGKVYDVSCSKFVEHRTGAPIRNNCKIIKSDSATDFTKNQEDIITFDAGNFKLTGEFTATSKRTYIHVINTQLHTTIAIKPIVIVERI